MLTYTRIALTNDGYEQNTDVLTAGCHNLGKMIAFKVEAGAVRYRLPKAKIVCAPRSKFK